MSPFQRVIGAVAAATIIGAGIAGGYYYVNPPAGPSGSGLANVWISNAGNDANAGCKFNAVPITDPGASQDCATPQKACALAPTGGTTLVDPGVYTIGFNVSNCNPTATLTFKNVAGTNAFFAGNSTISGSSNITLQGDAVGHNVGLSLGKTVLGGSGTTSNIFFNNVNLYCQSNVPWLVITSGDNGHIACNDSISMTSGLNGFTWNGGDQSNWASCLYLCTWTNGGVNPNDDAISPGATNILIEHIQIYNYYSIDTIGSTLGDHSEMWRITGGTNVEFLDNKFTTCNPPASTGYPLGNTCNSGMMEFGQSAPGVATADHYTFIQNIVDAGHPGMPAIKWDYDFPIANETTLEWLYNDLQGWTMCGKNSVNNCGPSSPNLYTGSNVIQVGNIGQVGLTGGCYSATSVELHNVYYNSTGNAANCTASDVPLNNTDETGIYTFPGDPSYIYTLKTGSAALVAGENTYCPSTDINGNPRPTSTPCDAGAIQTTVPTNPGDSLATCSPSACTTGSFVAHALTVDDGSGKNVTENVYVSRPANLTGTAPLVVAFENNPPGGDFQNWAAEAAAGKFVLLDIPSYPTSTYPPPTTWTGAGASPPATCGVSGTLSCDEVPLVVAAISQIACAGLTGLCQNIDPNKVYATGGSTAGAFTWDVMCDTRSSSLFSAYAPVSATIISPNSTNTQQAAGTPPCPAMLGTTNGWNSEPAGLAANTKSSILAVYGTGDGVACATAGGAPAGGNCLDTGWGFDSSGRWHFSIPQLVGFTTVPTCTIGTGCSQTTLGRGNSPVAGSDLGFGVRLGCPGTPTSTATPATSAYTWQESIFSTCTTPGVAVAQFKVVGGGHVPDSTPAGDQARLIWAFFVAYGGHH